MEQFSRTELLLGGSGMERLSRARVAVFGIGGVGGHVTEALARSGVGALELIDSDKVSVSNINRQIVATLDAVGKYKTDVMKERIAQINPDAEVVSRKCFFLPETSGEFDFSRYDYVVDAVDTVSAKIELVMKAKAAGVPIICSMGAGNKLDPTAFEVADIYSTSVCPLARVMRGELRKRGVERLKVVYSKEPPITPLPSGTVQQHSTLPSGAVADCGQAANGMGKGSAFKRTVPGSTAFVPSVAGLIIAGEVVKDICFNRT